MKILRIISCLIGISSFVFINSVQSATTKKIKIASYVGVALGGDIAQYEMTLARIRNQTRQMYSDDIRYNASLLNSGYFYPTYMSELLLRIEDAVDRKRDLDKIIASAGIGFSVGEFFKAEIEKLYTTNSISALERRIEFVNMFPSINGRVSLNPNAQYDHYVFIQMAHIGGGQFRMSATLGAINEEGTERTYEGEGFLNEALAEVAEKLFRSVMEVEFPTWKTPNQMLTWIPGPPNVSFLDSKEASIYCAGQEARLPLADELILAQHGTAFREGGINRFRAGDNYFVADQMRQASVMYFVTLQAGSDNGKMSVQALAGQSGKVWCVKGKMSERDALIQKLYSTRRKLDSKGINLRFFSEDVTNKNLPALVAIESLLIHLNAAGALLNETLKPEDLLNTHEALDVLRGANITLTIPQFILSDSANDRF